MGKRHTTIVIFVSLVLFFIWQLVDHVVLMNLPMATQHLISLIVGTMITLVIAGFATSVISRQYNQLKQLEQSRDDMIHMIVHDLRTPLTSMIGSLQTMQIGTFGELNPDMAEFVDMSVKGSERMLGMVNDLLDISKMDAGSMQLEIEKTKVIDLAASAVSEVQYLIKEKEIQLEVTIQPDTLEVMCDVDKIRRVITNLLGNAIKFTPAKGSVNFSVSGDSSGITISVSDTGEGIPEDYIDKIFDKFGQVESRKAGRRRSTGLGLTFCKLAVEAHKGNIWVDSTLGKGSTFSFKLPAV
ncbi:MAG: sensor histidine kinase [Armatimonadota bacterium]